MSRNKSFEHALVLFIFMTTVIFFGGIESKAQDKEILLERTARERDSSELFPLQVREKELVEQLGEGHPSVTAIREQIKRKEELIEALREKGLMSKAGASGLEGEEFPRLVKLEYASAAELAGMIRIFFKDVALTADAEDNSLSFRADNDTVVKFLDFIEQAEANAKQRMEATERSRQGASAKDGSMVTMELRYLSPLSAIQVLNDLGLSENSRLSHSGNTLLVNSKERMDVALIEQIVERIDVPKVRADAGIAGGFDDERSPQSEPGPVEHDLAGSDVRKLRFPKNASAEDQKKLFLAKQDFLRRQIALQRSKLDLLEKRLEQREKMAAAMFESVDEQWSRLSGSSSGTILTGDTQLEFDEDTGTVVVRGKKEDVDRVLSVIDKIKERAAADDAKRMQEAGDGQSEEPRFEVIELQQIDTQMAIAAVNKFFAVSRGDAENPLIVDGDILKSQLWVKGTAEQVEQVKQFIATLDSPQPVADAAKSQTGETDQEDAKERRAAFFEELRSKRKGSQ